MVKRAVLFANGEMPHPERILPLLSPNDHLIAVDGGLRHLRSLKRLPQLLIGDLDSVNPEEIQWAEKQGVEIKRFKVDKDETDLELALLAVARDGFEEILMIGALGGRLDHTLGNLFLLMLPELAGLRVILTDGIEDVLLIHRSIEIDGAEGDILSLIPIQGDAVGVETWNLKYPLKQETLKVEKSRGISNVMLGAKARVTLFSGCLLCIHTRRGNSFGKNSE